MLNCLSRWKKKLEEAPQISATNTG